MLQSLTLIQEAKAGNRLILKEHNWLKYLYLTKEQHVNLDRVDSLEAIPENPILPYVEKTLGILQEMELPKREKEVIEDVLIWSEVSKGGTKYNRRQWTAKGYQLYIHNIGSAQIYAADQMDLPFHQRDLERETLIYHLILTHGSVGQFIRGELCYNQLDPLIEWLGKNDTDELDMKRVLLSLNQCVVKAVSHSIWQDISSETKTIIDWIVAGDRCREVPLKERLRRLRQATISKGENFDRQYDLLMENEELRKKIHSVFRNTDMWYVESALQDFTLEEFIKIFLLISRQANPLSLEQVSFETFMRDIYYDYKGNKAVNLYKKRIIESYLASCTMDNILKGINLKNEHVTLEISPSDDLGNIVSVRFQYSKAGQKLIEFCQEAEKSPLYERAIILLYDFFGFRKDVFDRLQNEQTYLTDMNNSQDHKKVIADYARGKVILDIGAGGGVMLDVLSQNHPDATVIGIDISTNVIEELSKRKTRENRKWQVQQADALELNKYYTPGSVDTIVFSSILHEMFSYIPYNGKKFNKEVIAQALKSSFEVLDSGGRIIIRDGIMSEPKASKRLLRFRNKHGMEFFHRYVKDFKGRKIEFELIDDKTLKLPVNDLMEFCYTYTWGEEAYPHEVQEQFGYFTPREYRAVIEAAFGKRAEIHILDHYLQDGYEDYLLPKVEVMNEAGEIVPLPDSTCFIVIEKK